MLYLHCHYVYESDVLLRNFIFDDLTFRWKLSGQPGTYG